METRVCSVDGCGRPAKTKGYCGGHYQRSKATGSPYRYCKTCGADISCMSGAARKYCSPACGAWVPSANSKVRPKRQPAAPRPCVVCGELGQPGSGRVKHCSSACQALDSWNQGARPRSVDCVACGSAIDLLERGKAGRRRRADTKLCDPCRNQRRKHPLTVGQLVARDGTACGICGKPVETSLRSPHPMRPSIDHVIPRAKGGAHAPENLALAHLRCNQLKSDREGFVITAES